MIEYACHTCGESYPEGHRWDDEDNCTDCQSEQAPKGLTSYKLTILSSFTGQTWTGEYMDGASGEALLENIFRYFNRVTVEDGERLSGTDSASRRCRRAMSCTSTPSARTPGRRCSSSAWAAAGTRSGPAWASGRRPGFRRKTTNSENS